MKKILNLIFTIVIIAVFGYTVYKVIDLNMIPLKYLLIGFGTLFVFIVLFLIMMFRTKRWVLRIISYLLIAVASVGLIYVSTYAHTLIDFVSSSTTNTKELEYFLIARKKSNLTISDFNNETIGVIETDAENSKAFLEKLGIKDYETKLDNMSTLTENINSDDLKGMVLNEELLIIFKEIYTNFDELYIIVKEDIINIRNEVAPSINHKNNLIVYISGIDTYGNIGNRSRSDVNILAAINFDTNQVQLIHIPRDAYMKFHGTSGSLKDKLTHTGIYGIETSVKTLEDYFDIDINYYVRLNFSTLEKVVNTLDGIEVYNEKAFTSWDGEYFKKGNISLNGKEALSYARERKSLAGGDIGRGVHQQVIIEAIVNKAITPAIILKFNSIFNSLKNTFETNMSEQAISESVKKQLDNPNNWNFASYSITGKGLNTPTYTYPHQNLYVMELNQKEVAEAKNLMLKTLGS